MYLTVVHASALLREQRLFQNIMFQRLVLFENRLRLKSSRIFVKNNLKRMETQPRAEKGLLMKRTPNLRCEYFFMKQTDRDYPQSRCFMKHFEREYQQPSCRASEKAHGSQKQPCAQCFSLSNSNLGTETVDGATQEKPVRLIT